MNNPLLRFFWWLLTIPLEVLRAVLLPILKLAVSVRTMRGLAVYVLLVIALSGVIHGTQSQDSLGFLIFMVVALGVLQLVGKPLLLALRPWWRLAPRNAVTISKTTPAPAASVMVPYHAEEQTRATITARLSPELQRLMAG